VPQEDLQPLVELEALLQTLREQPQGTSVAKRRRDVRRARRCSPARAP
jgi:hypothetical protein